MTKFKNNVIGDNTPENVEYLKDLGYDQFSGCIDANCIFTDGRFNYFFQYIFTKQEAIKGYIDCRGNSPLFREKTAERREE